MLRVVTHKVKNCYEFVEACKSQQDAPRAAMSLPLEGGVDLLCTAQMMINNNNNNDNNNKWFVDIWQPLG